MTEQCEAGYRVDCAGCEIDDKPHWHIVAKKPDVADEFAHLSWLVIENLEWVGRIINAAIDGKLIIGYRVKDATLETPWVIWWRPEYPDAVEPFDSQRYQYRIGFTRGQKLAVTYWGRLVKTLDAIDVAYDVTDDEEDAKYWEIVDTSEADDFPHQTMYECPVCDVSTHRGDLANCPGCNTRLFMPEKN